MQKNGHKPTLYFIRETVAKHFGLTIKEMLVKSRKTKLVRARQIFMYIAHRKHGYNCSETGGFVLKDHATCLHSCGFISDVLDVNRPYHEVKDIETLIEIIERN